jgi:salicylate hydroxylase
MRVIIVGAGIAGLSLAISLGQTGHAVTLLESAPTLAEIGAGVQMTPNAIKCFFDLGLKDDLMAKSATPGHMNIRHGRKGHVLGSIAIRDLENDYGAPYILIHRAILHDILHKHSVKAGAKVRVNSKVVQYLFDSASVVLSNGETLSADLVVAADGTLASCCPYSHILTLSLQESTPSPAPNSSAPPTPAPRPLAGPATA